MALSIVVRLRFGRFDAASLDPLTPEWPPHPARVYCALVASGVEGCDWEALEWLERAGVPEVWVGEEMATARTHGYVVVNARSAAEGSQTWPGRTNGLRRRVSVLPSVDTFAVVWPGADPDETTVGRLARLAALVPYLGRSTSWAEVTVVPALVEPRPAWATYQMVPLGTVGSTQLRIPFPGYLSGLREAYERGNQSWHVAARTVAYAKARPASGDASKAAPIDGPYSDLLVWSLGPGRPIGGDDVLTVTVALRRAVMSRVPDPVPPEVSGHGADGRPHVAYLGLLDVGNTYAEGHVLGVGVAVPRGLTIEHRRALLRGLLGSTGDSPIVDVRDGRGRRLTLVYEPDSAVRWGLREERWRTATGGRVWVTATPLMLDRFPKRQDVAAAVAASVVNAGYPVPAGVDALPVPAVPGAIARVRQGTLPRRAARRPLTHCRIEFAQPLRGPVLVGSLRYLGCGLFVPETQSDRV